MKQKPWTDLHRREARAAYLLLWADRVVAGMHVDGVDLPDTIFSSEGVFRRILQSKAFDEETIARTLRRVRGIAEGRRVREKSEAWGIMRVNPNEYGRWFGGPPRVDDSREEVRRMIGSLMPDSRGKYFPARLTKRALRIVRSARR